MIDMLCLVFLSLLGALVASHDDAQPEELIYFGHNAVKGAQPWMVAITDSNGKYRCGGSLITPSAVLTAAHCVEKDREYNGFQAALGLYKRSDADITAERPHLAPGVQVIKEKEVIYHPKYKTEGPYTYDLAIVKLAHNARITRTVKTTPLSELSAAALRGQILTVTGWGRVEDFSIPDILQTAQFQEQPKSKCINELPSGVVFQDYHVCLRAKDGKADTCDGDSGSPLMFRGVQVGVLSQGSPNCNVASPSMYVNVAHFIPWIQSNAADIDIR